MALFWLRVYPTYEVLGWFFGLEKSDAWEDVQDVLAVLVTLADFPFERPAADRPKLATPEAVFAAFPAVKVVIDGKEQACRRPRGWDEQEPFYSGKKKRHTVKNQVVCTPGGRIGGVGATVPGSTHDPTLMRADGVRDRLAEGEGGMADKAYTGAAGDRPGVPVVVPAKATRGHPLTDAQEAADRVISGCRVVIEHVMAQRNRFQVLKQVFRSAFGRHSRVIRVVATLVDRRIAAVPLKTFGVN
jgi:DDE superfamily endonuclease